MKTLQNPKHHPPQLWAIARNATFSNTTYKRILYPRFPIKRPRMERYPLPKHPTNRPQYIQKLIPSHFIRNHRSIQPRPNQPTLTMPPKTIHDNTKTNHHPNKFFSLRTPPHQQRHRISTNSRCLPSPTRHPRNIPTIQSRTRQRTCIVVVDLYRVRRLASG